MSLARKHFTEFKERSGNVPMPSSTISGQLCRPRRSNEMIGEWKGGEFVTGHKMNGQLEKAGWFGKTFVSPSDVQPLVCLDADGNKFSNKEMGKGEASLWLEDFRSEVTATMVYDGQPVHDHFKKDRRRRRDGHHERQGRAG